MLREVNCYKLHFRQEYTRGKAISKHRNSVVDNWKSQTIWKMSRHHQGPGPIPDRWLYCPRNANSFVSEKFLAFKTPLSDEFTPQMPMECQFLPEMVFSYAKMFKVSLSVFCCQR